MFPVIRTFSLALDRASHFAVSSLYEFRVDKRQRYIQTGSGLPKWCATITTSIRAFQCGGYGIAVKVENCYPVWSVYTKIGVLSVPVWANTRLPLLRSRQIRFRMLRSRAPNQQTNIMPPAFRWRTVFEIAAIISVVYIFLGAPGSSGSLTSEGKNRDVVKPRPHIRPESLVFPDPDLKCPQHDYNVHIYSAKPLVIYIDGFLSHEEADALVDLR